DPRSPFVTSGLRIGTPAVTTRGFNEQDCIALTHWICDVLESLENGNSAAVIEEVKAKVLEVCARYPVYA
ncbi:MAG: glycine hydroxymethyltransferase, partial [Kiritimatiellia bacterium]